MDRRGFVGVAALGMLNACASLVITPVTPTRDGRIRLRLADYPALQRPGGSLKIRPDGSADTLYVLALEDGDFAVLSPICKHLGCTVGIEATTLLCPCHGSMYARDGSVLRGPTQAPLDRYPATVTDDGTLVITLEVDR